MAAETFCFAITGIVFFKYIQLEFFYLKLLIFDNITICIVFLIK